MANATSAFFERLAERGTVPELERTTGTLRVDVDRDGQGWITGGVEMRAARSRCSRSDADADLVLTAPARLFDDLASGQANALASTLRGELGVTGDPAGLVRFRAALPAADREKNEGFGADRRKAEGLTMAGEMIRILDGNTFVVCDGRGDIEALATEPTGLFSFDTRFLSTWVLTINGQKLNPLSVDDLHYFEIALLPRPPEPERSTSTRSSRSSVSAPSATGSTKS